MKKVIISASQLFEAITPKIVVPFDGNSVSDAVAAVNNPQTQQQLDTAQSSAGDATISLQGSDYKDNGPTQAVKKDANTSYGDAITQQVNPDLLANNPSIEVSDTIDESMKYTKKEIEERRKKKLKENFKRYSKKQLREAYEQYTQNFNDYNGFSEDVAHYFGQKVYSLQQQADELERDAEQVKHDLGVAFEDVTDTLNRLGFKPTQILFFKQFDTYTIEFHFPWVPTESDEDDEIYSELHNIGDPRSLVSVSFSEGDMNNDDSVISITFDCDE